MLTIMSIGSFFLTVNPLIKANGYQLLAAWMEEPRLREKANRALFGRLTGRVPAQDIDDDSRLALQAFALACLIFIVTVGCTILVFSARWLELNYQGTGVAIFLAVFAYLVFNLRRRIQAKRAAREQHMSKIPQRMRHGVDADVVVPLQGQRSRNRSGAKKKKKRGWFKYVALAGLLVLLAQPYPYETGGAFTILPMERQDISARIAGTIEEIFFTGGELVAAGAVIAKLNAAEEQKNILTTKAAIKEQQAKLAKLQNSPTREEVELAKKRLDTATTQAKYSRETAARMAKVYEKGSISLEQNQDVKRKMDVDEMEVLESRANLEKIKAGSHPQEIEAAQFELERLQEQLKYYDAQMALTELVVPIDGVIVTRNLKHMMGNYLNKGDLFASIENQRKVLVEVKVPESDISEVAISAAVRMKVWAYPDRFFLGEVINIAPVIEQETAYERVTMVTTVVDNHEELLRSGMTGFAKIDGGTKPVIVAFTRMFVRFFMVEMWSWLP